MNSYSMTTFPFPTCTQLLCRIMFHLLFTQPTLLGKLQKEATLLQIQPTATLRNHKHVTKEAIGKEPCLCCWVMIHNVIALIRPDHSWVQIYTWPRKQKLWMDFLPLLKARLKYLNGSKGNIQPFVFLPNIWSFGEPPETVNQTLCVGLQGE